MAKILSLAASLWPPEARVPPPIQLRSVCTFWNQVAQITPELWTTIRSVYSRYYVEMALRCSRGTPLRFVQFDYGQSPSILSHHAKRVVCLEICARNHVSLQELFSLDLRNLETLTMSTPSLDKHVVSQILPPSLYGLKKLIVQGVELPTSSLSLFQALETLELEYSLDSSVYFVPLKALFTVIQNTPLRRLFLHSRFITGPMQLPSSPGVVIHRLTALHLTTCIPDAAVFFASIKTHRFRRLLVNVYTVDDDDILVSVFLLNLRRFMDAMQLPSIPTIQAYGHQHRDNSGYSVVSFDHNSTPRHYFRFILESHDKTAARLLHMVIDHLELTSVERLELSASSHRPGHVSPKSYDATPDWHSLFLLLHRLTSIRIEDTAVIFDSLPAALGATQENGQPLCPRLSHIEFSNGGFYHHQCHTWYNQLLRRSEIGYTIQTLRFHKWTFPRWPYWTLRLEEVCGEIEVTNSSQYLIRGDHFFDNEGDDKQTDVDDSE